MDKRRSIKKNGGPTPDDAALLHQVLPPLFNILFLHIYFMIISLILFKFSENLVKFNIYFIK